MQQSTKSNLCRVPVSAMYRMIDGQPVMIEAEYEEIEAEKLLDFLLRKSGKGAGPLRKDPEKVRMT